MLPLYQNIKRLRTELNISQEKLAQMTGYGDRSSIAKIEQGIVDLPQSKIIEIANALNVSPGELMGDVPPTPQLRPDEQQLLDGYNQLDQEDRAEVRGIVKGMLINEKYTKSSREKKA